MSRHTIETLTWVCQGSNRQVAHAQQQRVSDFMRGEGVRVLDALFDRLSPDDEVWRIDRLEVELGDLSPGAGSDTWSRQLQAAVDTALQRLRQDAPPSQGDASRAGQPQHRQGRDLEHFLYYLQHGHLHWSLPTLGSGGMADWLERLARQGGSRLWEAMQRLPHADRALRRLSHITPCHGLQALLSSRHAELAQALTTLDDALLEPLRSQGRLSLYEMAQVRQAWRVAGLHALWGQGGSSLGVSRVRRLMATLAETVIDRLSGSHIEGTVSLVPASDASDLLRSLMLGMRRRLAAASRDTADPARPQADEHVAADAALEDAAGRLLLDVGWQESLRQFALAHQHAPPVRAAGLSLSALQAYLFDCSLAYLAEADRPPQDHVAWRRVWQQALDALAHDQADEALTAHGERARPVAEAAERPMIRNSRNNDGTISPADDYPGDEAIYIANAGLVLLAPFLPRLFAMLKLMRDDVFVDDSARHRAVHALVYLTDGNVLSEEHAWVLNKLMCGLPVDEPVPPAKTIEDMQPVLDSLLPALISHWKALGQTTPMGLRQTFLCRIGRLAEHETEDGDHWRLKVQPGSFDVLLDRLPWGYATIKLPWMKGAIHVDWR